MKPKRMRSRRKKSLVGWANTRWLDVFTLRLLDRGNLLTKQNMAMVVMPFITNPCTKYLDGRSHKKVKVKITIEEVL